MRDIIKIVVRVKEINIEEEALGLSEAAVFEVFGKVATKAACSAAGACFRIFY